MVATVLHPRAVPITTPSTSPMAHPVRQCSVAEKAVRLSELFQVAINILPVSVNFIIYPYGVSVNREGRSILLRRALRSMVGVRLGVCILVCGVRIRHRGGTVALRVRDPYGRSPHRRGARPRGRGGGLGRRFLLGRHLCRWHGHVRPVGRDGCDGDAHREGEDRGRVDAAGPAETVEAGPRDDRPRPFVQGAPPLAGRTWSLGRRWFLEGGRTDRQEGSGTASRRESGDTYRVVERGGFLLCRRALPARGDDLLATSCPEATHPCMGGRGVAEQEVNGAGAALRWGTCGHGRRECRIVEGYDRDHLRDQGLRRGKQRRGWHLRHRMGGPDAR